MDTCEPPTERLEVANVVFVLKVLAVEPVDVLTVSTMYTQEAAPAKIWLARAL